MDEACIVSEVVHGRAPRAHATHANPAVDSHLVVPTPSARNVGEGLVPSRADCKLGKACPLPTGGRKARPYISQAADLLQG